MNLIHKFVIYEGYVMMFTFNEAAWELFKQNPEQSFTSLSVNMLEQNKEQLFLAQYLVFVGAKVYAEQHNVPLAKMNQVLFARADIVKSVFTPHTPNTADPIVKPCGGCGGGKVR